ncbi:iron ABC transporter permease [Maricaulaceae bacterium EIL42A08]|nr:iron ABC transporter permease [Maricaulaceae bacterium EIL42A08]
MKPVRLLIALGIASLVTLVLSVANGTADLGLEQTLAGLFGAGDATTAVIIWEIRLPRALAAFLTGAALGASGAALQGLLRNPLADPGVLGVSASASLGAVIALYFGLASLSAFALPALALIGALAATAVLAVLGAGRLGPVGLILAGVGLSSFAGALTALTINLAPNPFAIADLITWMLGSVANRSWVDLGFAAPFWVAGAVLLALAAPGLRSLSLGEETAASLGADVGRIRLLTVLGTALLTGAAVAVAGVIGFVGIVAPHLIRPFVNHDPARLIWPSALLAGVLLSLADLVLRLAPLDQELRLGVMAALIGAPAFIWIAARNRGIGQ